MNARTNKSTQTPAQQAELKKLRARKSAAADVSPPQDVPGFTFKSSIDEALEMARSMGIIVPSWKRTLAAGVASMITGYVVGNAALVLTNVLMMATIAATGSQFLAILSAIIAFLLGLYVTIKCTQKVGSYILTGDIDADIINTYSKVRGWFKPRTVSIA